MFGGWCSVESKTLNQSEYSVLVSETTPLDPVPRVLQRHSHAGRRRDTQVLQEKEYDYLRPQTERVCGDWLVRPTVVIGLQPQVSIDSCQMHTTDRLTICE